MIKNWILLLCILCTVSCSKFSKLQKSDDLEVKKQGAFDYYDKKDFFRASQLLEELVPLLKGTQDAEKAEYLYAMCQYEQRILETATYFFDNFLVISGIMKIDSNEGGNSISKPFVVDI